MPGRRLSTLSGLKSPPYPPRSSRHNPTTLSRLPIILSIRSTLQQLWSSSSVKLDSHSRSNFSSPNYKLNRVIYKLYSLNCRCRHRSWFNLRAPPFHTLPCCLHHLTARKHLQLESCQHHHPPSRLCLSGLHCCLQLQFQRLSFLIFPLCHRWYWQNLLVS